MAQQPRAIIQLQTLEDRTTPTAEFAPGQVLVGFNPGQEQQGLASVSDPQVVAGSKALGFGIYKLTLQPGASVDGSISRLSGRPGVKFVEPNYIVKPSLLPNDPSFVDGSLWGQRNTGQNGGLAGADANAVAGWDIGTGTGQTVVAIIDFGVEYTHPDLAANMWTNPGEVPGDGVDNDSNGFVDDVHGWDFTRDTGDILPGIDDDHGTHVAGTVGAVGNNGVGVTGMTWKTRLMTVPLFSNGAGAGTTSVAIQALNYAVMMGSKLSNNSWGGPGDSQALFDAIQQAGAQGHVFVTAAGNDAADNDNTPSFPSNYYPLLNNLVSVAAFDRRDQLADFSSYGKQTVTLGAPGVEILSTSTGGGYATHDGTSMATPQVTGALAAFMDATADLTPAEIIAALKLSVRKIPAAADKTDTGGVLDMGKLMELSGSGVFAVGADAGGGPHVKVYSGGGRLLASFFAYDQSFTGGVRVATGDVNGDRIADIITVAGPTGGPHVKVFDGKTFQELYSFYAFEPTFTGGLNVAAGDVNGDGRADVIVGADEGGGPRVSVFALTSGSSALARIADFYAYAPNFTGGVRVAAGLFTANSKQADIVVAPGAGGGPHVRRFTAASVLAYNPAVAVEAMVGDPNSRTGLFVAAGDMDGNGLADIVTGTGTGTPLVSILNGQTMALIAGLRAPVGGEMPGLINPGSPTSVGANYLPVLDSGLLPPASAPDSLIPGNSNVKPATTYGVRVAIMDANGDDRPDLLLSGGSGDAPTVSIVNGVTYSTIRLLSVYAPSFFGGVFVGAPGS